MTTNETMEARIELALSACLVHEDKTAENWREAVRRWGVDSGGARGWLLDLAREAWGDPFIHVASDGLTWQPVNGSLDDIDVGYQELEINAIVALLEATP